MVIITDTFKAPLATITVRRILTMKAKLLIDSGIGTITTNPKFGKRRVNYITPTPFALYPASGVADIGYAA